MDLRRYKSIVLHIGGHDVDADITFTSFREEYQSLLTSVKQSGCKTYVSGLLPRGGTNMKPFNETLRELCSENDCTFIDNHDSFVMASGELPFEFFLADQVNLKFPGIRALANNINSQCPILPKPNQTHNIHQQGRMPQPMRRPGHLHRGKRYTSFKRHKVIASWNYAYSETRTQNLYHILDSICIECNDFLNNDQCDCINNKSTESSAPHLEANTYARWGSLSMNIMDHFSSEASCLINQTPERFQSNTLDNKIPNDISTEFRFNSRGIHNSIYNLNIRHLKPKLDDMKIVLDLPNNIDIFGVRETFLDQTV